MGFPLVFRASGCPPSDLVIGWNVEAGQGGAPGALLPSRRSNLEAGLADSKPTPSVEIVSASVAVTLEAPPELQHGVYSNLVQVRATEYDFILDFGQSLPAQSQEEAEKLLATKKVTLPAKVRVVLPILLVPKVIEILKKTMDAYTAERGLKVPEQKQGGANVKP